MIRKINRYTYSVDDKIYVTRDPKHKGYLDEFGQMMCKEHDMKKFFPEVFK